MRDEAVFLGHNDRLISNTVLIQNYIGVVYVSERGDIVIGDKTVDVNASCCGDADDADAEHATNIVDVQFCNFDECKCNTIGYIDIDSHECNCGQCGDSFHRCC